MVMSLSKFSDGIKGMEHLGLVETKEFISFN